VPGGTAAKWTVRMPWSSSSCIARAAVALHGTSGGSPPSAVLAETAIWSRRRASMGRRGYGGWQAASRSLCSAGASGARVLSNDIR